MDREQETLNVIQGLLDLVKNMQIEINKLTCEIAELRTKIISTNNNK